VRFPIGSHGSVTAFDGCTVPRPGLQGTCVEPAVSGLPAAGLSLSGPLTKGQAGRGAHLPGACTVRQYDTPPCLVRISHMPASLTDAYLSVARGLRAPHPDALPRPLDLPESE
jgi:hypothetical protein